LKYAVELQPGYAEPHHWLSWVYQLLGRRQEAFESAKRAVELNPLSLEAVANLSTSSLIKGDYESALAEARRLRELQPDWITGRHLEGIALYRLGQLEEAKSVLRNLTVPWTGAGAEGMLAIVHAAAGDTESAREISGHLEENGAFFEAGMVYAALGQVDEAFQLFEKVDYWSDYWPTLATRYHLSFVSSSLQNDPRYESLLREVNRNWGLNPDGSLPAP
jgi:hypothetical protein